MRSLISPNEQVVNYDGAVLGSRIVQVAEVEFPVAEPLFWVECAVIVVADEFYWADGEILPIPSPPLSQEQTPPSSTPVVILP